MDNSCTWDNFAQRSLPTMVVAVMELKAEGVRRQVEMGAHRRMQ